MINYTSNIKDIHPDQLKGGFFADWGDKYPSPEKHLEILQNSYAVVLAIDEATNEVVGFINAISDGVISAYIPLLEVVRDYQGQGIGKELVDKMIEELDSFYMVDLLCDTKLQPFYEKRGMMKVGGMCIRNFSYADGENY
ncbi:GNAT family N-acetyltransferase [Bacillus shivajii]|uniref:GNAT family N-acetyltransferase n=1 Tax=Bacillus shivajii TaxID=1983719 RepID=UPI001CFA534D|nr:GNAT family N-acetyltransferase [Bacillus shivajii]UCZ54028.1 GNAT family N-acetyltransferase [Bacillus shivajii]